VTTPEEDAALHRLALIAAAVGGQGSRDPVRARPLTAVAPGAYTEGVPLMVRRSGSCEEMPR
jgi:hypothetical protein